MLIITDHKPLIAMFKKDVTTLSQCIQCIMLKIHQHRVQILYKPGPEIFIADWLCGTIMGGQGQTHKGYGHMSGCHPELRGHARIAYQ